MPGSIQEMPLDNPDIAQPIEDNAQSIEDIAAEIPEEPVLEEVKPIKPKAKGRPKGSCNKGPSKPRAKRLQHKKLFWKLQLNMSPRLQRGISSYPLIQAPVMLQLPC